VDLIQVVELCFNQHGRNFRLSVCLYKCGCVNAGQSSPTRYAGKHLDAFVNLANLLSKNASRLHEADTVSFRCFVHVAFSSTCIFRYSTVSFMASSLNTDSLELNAR